MQQHYGVSVLAENRQPRERQEWHRVKRAALSLLGPVDYEFLGTEAFHCLCQEIRAELSGVRIRIFGSVSSINIKSLLLRTL